MKQLFIVLAACFIAAPLHAAGRAQPTPQQQAHANTKKAYDALVAVRREETQLSGVESRTAQQEQRLVELRSQEKTLKEAYDRANEAEKKLKPIAAAPLQQETRQAGAGAQRATTTAGGLEAEITRLRRELSDKETAWAYERQVLNNRIQDFERRKCAHCGR